MSNPIIDTTNKESESNKKKLGKILFDFTNPKMISWLFGNEIEHLGIFSAFGKQENIYREKFNYGKNPIEDIITELLVLRCSKEGWRANQGVDVMKAIVNEEQEKQSMFGLKKMLGGV